MGLHQKVCTRWETINKMKGQPTEWKKIFTDDLFNKSIISKMYKELRNSPPEKQTTQLKSGQRNCQVKR